jgi:quercetin dioxygenase-like cupin family protein
MSIEQLDTRCIADDSLPWMPYLPWSDLVSVKLYRVDPLRGEVISVVRAPPGVELPRYRHAGTATIYTIQGRWKYRERDWVAGPGSVVIESASAQHTPQSLADGTDDVIMFVVATGEHLLLDAAGRVVATENWRTAVDRYLEYCREHGLEPRDLTGHDA